MLQKSMEKLNTTLSRVWMMSLTKIREVKGQGTTEYAILVGVLVVIAIIAVVAFRPKLQSLWDGITQGINSL